MAPIDNLRSPESSKNNNKNIISQAQKSFVEDKIEGNLNFFDSLNSSDIFTNFRSFLNSKPKFRDLALTVSGYTSDQQNTLSEQIKDETLKVIYVRKKNLADLEKIFLSEYNSINSGNLISKISGLSILELKDLLSSETKRIKFLKEKNIFSNEDELNKERKIGEKNILDNIKISKSAFRKLPQDQKEYLFHLFNDKRAVDFSSLEVILNTLDDKNSKSNLIKYFISSISVADLEKQGLLKTQSKDLIIDSIKKSLSVNESKAKEIYNDLDKSEIFLSTKDLKDLDLSSFLDDSSFKKKIIDEYNYDLAESGAKKNSFEDVKLNEKGEIHKSFINIVKYDPSIKQEIRENIHLLQVGNIIELNGEDGKKGYYHIKKVDNGNTKETKSMVLENISGNNGIKKVGNGFDETHTYSSFYKLLEKISSSDSKNPYSIKFTSIENIKNSGVSESIENSSDINSYDELLKGLDSLDSSAKEAGLSEKGTVIVSEKDGFVFNISSLNKLSKTITLDQGGKYGKKTLSFKEFFEIMKSSKQGLKRKKKINTFSEVLTSTTGLTGYKISSGKLYSNDNKKPINFFIGDGNKAIYIKDISETSIDYSMGSLKEEKKGKKIKKVFDGKDGKAYNFNQLIEDINKNSLVPQVEEEFENKESKELEKKSSLIKSFLSGLSLKDIMNSGTFLVDGIKKKLERGNRLKSIRFAQKFGFLFGDDFKNSLDSSAEQEEKSLIEEIKSNLQAMDSGPMIQQIIRVLQNRSSEQYEIIASLLSVLKYGNLYPKALSSYSGSFMWYKALGGTEEFKRKKMQEIAGIKKRASGKEEKVNFTEEDLVMQWIKSNSGGKGKDMFRSKLWKDYAKELSGGFSGEKEAGLEEGSKKITYDGIMSFFVGNLDSREYAGAIGSIEAVFAKNTDSIDMQAVPFVLGVSGYGKDFGQEHVKAIQGLAFKTPYASLMYGIDEEGHKKYVNFIKALIEHSPKIKNKSKAKSDFESVLNTTDKKCEKAYDFWKTYGVDLVDYINFKDSMIALKADKIPEFKDFYDNAKGVWGDSEFGIKSEDIEIEIYKKNPVAMSGSGNALGMIRGNATGGFAGDSSKNAFNMYIDTLKSIKNSSGTLEEKNRVFKEVFIPFERTIAELHGQYIENMSTSRHPIYAEVVGNGLDVIKNQTKPNNYEDLIDNIFNSFMNSVTKTTSETENTIKNTKLSIDEILYNTDFNASNDENFR